ncbi:hypothetical protein N8600_05740 [Gammaproteobacteria bacterium]|jgi:hypothetical protein|nr:hypothetical protein [Gammaproteobacteria bacterium]
MEIQKGQLWVADIGRKRIKYPKILNTLVNKMEDKSLIPMKGREISPLLGDFFVGIKKDYR